MGLMAGFKEEREIKMPRTVFNLCDCNHRILLTASPTAFHLATVEHVWHQPLAAATAAGFDPQRCAKRAETRGHGGTVPRSRPCCRPAQSPAAGRGPRCSATLSERREISKCRRYRAVTVQRGPWRQLLPPVVTLGSPLAFLDIIEQALKPNQSSCT